jgi:hypothetical protein
MFEYFLKMIHVIILADAVWIAGAIRGRLKDTMSRGINLHE